jgi:hypothetical protein
VCGARHWSFDLTAWTCLCVTIGIICLMYLSLGLAASRGPLLMPLDDTYIDFQYARQMAHGEFYVYNPGDGPTSGATSLLYIPLLAVGYRLGFSGLSLAYWAVAIGALALLASGWLVYQLVRSAALRTTLSQPMQRLIAVILMESFAISGPLDWASLSGMETILFAFTVVLALYAYTTGRDRPAWIAAAAALATLTRPEGALVAGLAVAALGWQMGRSRRWSAWIGLPVLASILQPAINWLLTGSPAASGTQVKSHFYNETIPFGQRLEIVWQFGTRMWHELLTGHSPVTGWYVPPVISLLAVVAVGLGAWKSWRDRDVTPDLLAGGWMLLLTAAASTLDTGFWQFKRYQMPVMALMFPLAGWALVRMATWHKNAIWPVGGLLVAVGLVSLPGVPDYAGRYYENVVVTRDQQVAMARWIRQHIPQDARIAVHDVGAVRYVGNRATYDVVGLTTKGTGPAWRQGPGTFYDTMAHHPQRPDYMAIYPDFHGMPFLVQAGVFGEELQRFVVPLPHYTASAATGTQVVSRLDWPAPTALDLPRQPHPQVDLSAFTLVGTLNVADLANERQYGYEWWNRTTFDGFVSDVRRLPYAACNAPECTAVDGGRVLNGGERFTLPRIAPDQGYLLVLRAQAASPARLRVGCDDTIDTLAMPEIPGKWVEVFFWIPPGTLDPDHPRLCVTSVGGDKYYSYRYWIYAGSGTWSSSAPPQDVRASFVEPDGSAAAELVEASVEQTAQGLSLRLTWNSDGRLTRDGKLFVHLYADPQQPPVAQIDVWPGYGVLPPANWLNGTWSETVFLPLAGVSPGTYRLAVGLYDPVSSQRYTVLVGGRPDASGRLFLGGITIKP